MSTSPQRAKRLLLLLVLLIAPLALRLAPIGHGSPRNYIPDTHVVRSALGMAQAQGFPTCSISSFSLCLYISPTSLSFQHLLYMLYSFASSCGYITSKHKVFL